MQLNVKSFYENLVIFLLQFCPFRENVVSLYYKGGYDIHVMIEWESVTSLLLLAPSKKWKIFISLKICFAGKVMTSDVPMHRRANMDIYGYIQTTITLSSQPLYTWPCRRKSTSIQLLKKSWLCVCHNNFPTTPYTIVRCVTEDCLC